MSEALPVVAKIKRHSKAAFFKNTVAFAVDDKYFPFALFVANQILEKELNRDFDITICLPNLASVGKDWLNSDIRFCEFELSGIEKLPVGGLSLAAYHRLFLPSVFNNEYEKILYLDADTYINKPFITELFKKSSMDFVIAAAPDVANILAYSSPYNMLTNYLKQYQDKKHIYKNSGVLLINTKKFNQENCLDKVINYALSNIENLTYHDQTALNCALQDQISTLSFGLNWQVHEDINPLFSDFNPTIIHFIAENKPWVAFEGFSKNYQIEYHEFLGKNFPELPIKIFSDSTYQNRLARPKYQNKIREFISRETSRIRRWLKRNLGKQNKNTQLPKIKNSLTSMFESAEFKI